MADKINIITLVENTATKQGLLAEHGLSFLIQTSTGTILFDTGQGKALENNAELLGVDLFSIGTVVLSHGHYDHTGGLDSVLLRNSNTGIYMHPGALKQKYVRNPDGTGREIGIPGQCRESLKRLEKNIVFTEGPEKIADGIYVTGEIPRVTAYEDTGGPFFVDEDCSNPDMLPDDQALFFDTTDGLVVILGCAHSGVINTLEHIKNLTGGKAVNAIIGGMHLLRASDERMAGTIEYLYNLNLKCLCAGHCTGAGAVHELHSAFPEQSEFLFVGKKFSFEADRQFALKQ
jgi:7,8-dihydropterin-6-yl-methyl-4-(beta-D-ribofuranosyl)aminobenzene 5'-phosphate synthase